MEKSEVICISSEDEEDVPQSGGIIAKAPSSRMLNTNTSQLKTDIASQGDTKAEMCMRKRSAGQVKDDNIDHSVKRLKLSTKHEEPNNKGNSIDAGSNESEHISESNGKKHEVILKPKLVEKKRKVISTVVQDTFPMFISLCLQKEHSEDMKRIVSRLKRRYEQLDPAYANSENFIDFLNEKRNDITNSRNKLYVYINDVMNEMKNISKGTSTLLSNKDYRKKSVSHLGESTSNEEQVNGGNTDTDCEDEEEDSMQERQIRLLEETMDNCEKRIKKLEQTEINFDDENNSDYIKLERYKQRMVELYNKYCQLTGNNPDAERSYLRPKHFRTTGIDAVDMAISSFINSNISKRQKKNKVGGFTSALIFPDYRDILQCVEKCNKDNDLRLDEKTQKQIAKKAFTDLGRRLQRARQEDFLETFAFLVEECDEDPAVKDPVLAKKLKQSKEEGEARLRDVFEEYVKKQEETKDQMPEDKSSDDDEDDDSSETEADSCDADDNVSECSSVDNENNVLESDGSSRDKPSLSTNDLVVRNKDSADNANIDEDLIEIDTNSKRNSNESCVSDMSNANDHNNLKSNNTDCAVNALNCENNPKSQVQKPVNDVVSPHVSVSPDVAVSGIVTDTVSTGSTEEGEAKILCEDSIENTPLEEDKPLLRVRSFAKPPTTWQDGRPRTDELSVDGSALKVVTIDANIDLTNKTRTQSTVISKYGAVQIGSKVLPALKRKYGTIVIPKGQSIVKVKNITKNYVSVNLQTMDRKNVANQQRGKIKSQQVVHLDSDLPEFRQTANTSRLVKSTEVGKQNSVKQMKQFKKAHL